MLRVCCVAFATVAVILVAGGTLGWLVGEATGRPAMPAAVCGAVLSLTVVGWFVRQVIDIVDR